MVSNRKLLANRLNAQKSTGPRTSSGKAASATNAVIHGLTAALPVLTGLGETREARDAYRTTVVADLAPIGAAQTALAERFADLSWRLVRASRFDAAAVAATFVPAAAALAAPTDRAHLIRTRGWNVLQQELGNLRASTALLARPDDSPPDGLVRPAVARMVWEVAAAAARRVVTARPTLPGGPPVKNWFDPDTSLITPPSPEIIAEWDAARAVELYCTVAKVPHREAVALEEYREWTASRIRAGLTTLAGFAEVPTEQLAAAAADRLGKRVREVEAELPAAARAQAEIEAAAVLAALRGRDGAAAAAVDLSVRYERHLGRELESILRMYLALKAAGGVGWTDDPD